MNLFSVSPRASRAAVAVGLRVGLAAALLWLWLCSTTTLAQAPAPGNAGNVPSAPSSGPAPPEGAPVAPRTTSGTPGSETTPVPEAIPSMNLLDLLIRGGIFMIPILLMSVVTVYFAIERWIALQRSRIVPRDLTEGLAQLTERPGGLDPRLAYRFCQKHRSVAANVLRAVLLKVGRPLDELEKAATSASEREAAVLYNNVRFLNLSTAISPLLGLLGTVWGMIQAFFVTSQAIGGAKANQLAGGIYEALVTTLAGLCVAIPSAILAHRYEGKIQELFREIDDLVQSVLPQLERYEGKLRMTKANLVEATDESKPEPRPARQPAGTKE